MRGSRKFCQRGSNFDNVVVFLVDEGWEDPNTTVSRPSSEKRHGVSLRADDGPTLNTGLVASRFFRGS